MTNQEPVSLKKKTKKAQQKVVASDATSPLVALLEAGGFRVQAENDALAAAARHRGPVLDGIDASKAEPALT